MDCPKPASQCAALAHFALTNKNSLALPLLLFPKNVAKGSIFREPCFICRRARTAASKIIPNLSSSAICVLSARPVYLGVRNGTIRFHTYVLSAHDKNKRTNQPCGQKGYGNHHVIHIRLSGTYESYHRLSEQIPPYSRVLHRKKSAGPKPLRH